MLPASRTPCAPAEAPLHAQPTGALRCPTSSSASECRPSVCDTCWSSCRALRGYDFKQRASVERCSTLYHATALPLRRVCAKTHRRWTHNGDRRVRAPSMPGPHIKSIPVAPSTRSNGRRNARIAVQCLRSVLGTVALCARISCRGPMLSAESALSRNGCLTMILYTSLFVISSAALKSSPRITGRPTFLAWSGLSTRLSSSARIGSPPCRRSCTICRSILATSWTGARLCPMCYSYRFADRCRSPRARYSRRTFRIGGGISGARDGAGRPRRAAALRARAHVYGAYAA